ncbi:hypothetical protein MPTK1_6g05110 [Marchantia polymorpha subsp. ruderalis]|uniref:Uncharacterized protein n=2 Tax=Marchantia polymorpha TaxID=3197 RepID=A0AAF6BNP8_MARPO|nr:hypothetical protein MARPO_0034s0007 [Marchantia polymorpha]BBN13632.1 hypothetical protein Mp_6g05110 [Marchantia polymorpha subsp. ruderalis]|eukprot:PTQ41397.1 hypothetical protein MARPO_0034s0007 [Marchantia polymorpha]
MKASGMTTISAWNFAIPAAFADAAAELPLRVDRRTEAGQVTASDPSHAEPIDAWNVEGTCRSTESSSKAMDGYPPMRSQTNRSQLSTQRFPSHRESSHPLTTRTASCSSLPCPLGLTDRITAWRHARRERVWATRSSSPLGRRDCLAPVRVDTAQFNSTSARPLLARPRCCRC